jgi:hypothetical protein
MEIRLHKIENWNEYNKEEINAPVKNRTWIVLSVATGIS